MTIAHGKSRYQQKDSTLWGLASTWEIRLTGPIPRPERTLTAKLATTQRYAHRTHDQRRAAMNVGATLTPAVGTHGAHSPAGIADKTS